MLIGIDSNPVASLYETEVCSTTKCHQNESDLKNVFVQFFFNVFYSFNPNQAYWNQRRLFSGNLSGMFFNIIYFLIEINFEKPSGNR